MNGQRKTKHGDPWKGTRVGTRVRRRSEVLWGRTAVQNGTDGGRERGEPTVRYTGAVFGTRKHAAMPRHGTGPAWRILAVGNHCERRRDTREGKARGRGKLNGHVGRTARRVVGKNLGGALSRQTTDEDAIVLHRAIAIQHAAQKWGWLLFVNAAGVRRLRFLRAHVYHLHYAFPRLTF